MLRGIDLFAGAGGMSTGAASAGVRLLAAVELRADACQTYAVNHPGVEVINADIRTLATVDVARGKDELVVFGGPPCQGFSTSNQRTRVPENPRNWLFVEFIRIVDAVGPDWVVFENVAGILQTDGGSFVKNLQKRLSNLGYRLSSGILNAADWGVPQRRSRYFTIGCRHATPPDIVPSSHTTSVPTVADALSDLPSLSNGAVKDDLPYPRLAVAPYARQLRGELTHCSGHLVSTNTKVVIERYLHIPQGGNWRDIPENLMGSYADRRRCHTGIYRRLAEGEPSTVIGNFRKNMLVHPTEHRGLSVREAARLQSFPDSYVFKGSIGIQQQQVGNAVPPLLAKAVFSKIVSRT